MNAVSGAAGALLVLMLTDITGTVAQLNGHELLNRSYLPNPNMGREWRSTLELVNLDDQPISVALNPGDQLGSAIDMPPHALESMQLNDMEVTDMIHIESRNNYMAATTFQSIKSSHLEVIPAIRDISKRLLSHAYFPAITNLRS